MSLYRWRSRGHTAVVHLVDALKRREALKKDCDQARAAREAILPELRARLAAVHQKLLARAVAAQQ